MIDSTLSLVKALREHQLLTAAQIQELSETLQSAYPEPRGLARELLQRGWLTPFQINRLLQGQGEELFLGPYVLLERLGEGGMGQVFKARHRLMNRIIALKVIRKERLANSNVAERFLREIQVSAQLSHPHIVIAHDAARCGDVLYFTMEFVDGSDLDKIVKKRGPLPATEACEYVRQTALGLRHAHERGLVHRDVKPHNLLLSKDGQIKILDMGLARLGESEEPPGAGLTHEGALVGTPDYMAPEQALDSHHADIRADLYSLGCTLYCLLAGRPPFAELPLSQKVGAHLHVQPRAIEELRSDLPRGLGDVLRKMLAKRPQDRYQTPAEVAVVLEKFAWRTASQSSAVTLPEPPPAAHHEAIATLALGAGPTPEVSSAPAAIPINPVPAALTVASMPATEAVPPPKWTRRQLILGIVGAGVAASLPLALLLRFLGKRNRPDNPNKDAPEQERYSWYPPELIRVLGDDRGRHWGAVRTVAYRSDGQWIASGGDDARIRLWNPETLREKEPATRGKDPPFSGHTAAIRQVLFTPDGQSLLSLGNDGTMRLWDAETGKERLKFAGSEQVARLVLSPDGKWIRGLVAPSTILSWELDSSLQGTPIALEGVSPFVTCWDLSPDGRYVLAAENTPTAPTWYQIRQWDAATGKAAATPLPGPKKPAGYERMTEAERAKVPTRSLTHLAAANEDLILIVANDGEIAVWNLKDRARKASLPKHESQMQRVALSANGKFALTYAQDGILRVFDAANGQERGRLEGHKGTVVNFTFSPDGARAITASDDSTLRQWDLAQCKELCPRAGHTHLVKDVAFSRDSQFVLTGGVDRTMRLWKVGDGRQLHEFSGHKQQGVEWVAFLADENRVLSSDRSFTNRLWDAAEERVVYSFSWAANDPPTAFWSARGKPHAYVGTAQGNTARWDVTTGKVLGFTVRTGHAPVNCLAVSADGLSVLAAGDNVLILHIDLATGKELFRQGGHARKILAVAFTPDGGHGLSVDEGGRLHRWNLREKGEPDGKWALEGALPRTITSMCFSPDAKLVACTGSNEHEGVVVLWDSRTGKERNRWLMPGPVQRLVFAPAGGDGYHLATANASGTVYVYHLEGKKA